VLLVTIDTLRADHVGAYGYALAETPTLDRLAGEGVLVEDAVVQVPQTRPSHASILTGRLPYEHGLRDNFSPPLEPAHPTLATLLKQQGYATGGFIGAYPVSRDSGLDRGFDVFDDPFSKTEGNGPRLDESARAAGAVVDAALAWLGALEARPFLAWVHVFDPHTPYAPPSPFRERFEASPYDGEIAYADAEIGRLLDWLERSGEAGRTLVVVTSDHGEGLGDHGEDEHQLFVYDSTLHVPLVVAWPGELPAGVRLQGQLRSVDLLPTILDLVGAPPADTSGLSRAANLRSGSRIPDNESYAESLYGQIHFGWAPLRALRAEGWKYIEAPRAELYDLREDPGETRNRLGDRSQVAEAMGARLHAYASTAPAAATVAVDPNAAERLATLGYVGGAFFTGAPSGADPKDKVAEYTAFRRETTEAVRLFEAGDFAGAARKLLPLTRPQRGPNGRFDQPVSYTVSFFLGRALLELGRFQEAIDPLEVALRFSPSTPLLYAALARAQAGSGRFEAAAATTERGLALAPEHPGLLQIKGRLLLRQGAVEPALRVLQQARRLAPRNASVRVDLSHLLRNSGQLEEALALAQEAVSVDPRSSEAQVARGLCLGMLRQSREAQAAFEAALELKPDAPDALFFGAMLALDAGHVADARRRLEQLVAVAPAYPKAREMLARARAAGR